MPTNKWTVDSTEFIEAVDNDEYAELELPNGDTLITDWEGQVGSFRTDGFADSAAESARSDGVFNPYVVLTSDHGDAHPTDILDDIAWAIEQALDVTVYHIEYSPKNGVFYPSMDRPTN